MTTIDMNTQTTGATSTDPGDVGDEQTTARPVPQFGLSYRVTAAARFDPPDELLGELLTNDLTDVDDVDTIIAHLSTAPTDESRSWKFQGYAVGVVGDRAVIVTADRSTSLEVDLTALRDILQHWRRHLVDVPAQLDRVSVEAAAAQRRIAAISWLESGVAVAAGHGWTVEAGRLSSIRNLIADGARAQNSTMHGAGESWATLREGFARRRPGDPSVESVVVALDQLLGT